MPRGVKHGVGEEEVESHLAGEVEEIKRKLVEMSNQNQQLGDNIQQMQAHMQENTIHMQQQMDNLMNLMLANEGKGGPREGVQPAVTEGTGSHLG